MRSLCTLVLLCSTAAFSQLATKQPDGNILVSVPLLILESKGLKGAPIDASLFAVKEDGQPINGFKVAAPVDDGILLAILLDASNSERELFKLSREIAVDTIGLVRPGKDEVALGAFNSTIGATKFTDDVDAAKKWLESVTPSGATAFYDSVYKFSEGVTRWPEAKDRNVVMIVISDGEDTQSTHTVDEAISAAQIHNLTLIPVYISLNSNQPRGARIMDRMAQQTGGILIAETSVKSVDKQLQQVIAQLHNRFYLSYTVPGESGGRHSLSIKPTGKLKISAPAARFDPPETAEAKAQ